MKLFEKIDILVRQGSSVSEITLIYHLTEEILQEKGMSLSDIYHSLNAHYRINFNCKNVL